MSATVKSFQDLKVWQVAMDLVRETYRLVNALPSYERFGLAEQIRRAAVSVPANIAEGQARRYTKEFLHHLSIARGSLAELQTLILVAERLAYLSQEQLDPWSRMVVAVRMMLSKLITRLQPRT